MRAWARVASKLWEIYIAFNVIVKLDDLSGDLFYILSYFTDVYWDDWHNWIICFIFS